MIIFERQIYHLDMRPMRAFANAEDDAYEVPMNAEDDTYGIDSDSSIVDF